MAGLRFCMVTTFYPPHHFGGDGMGTQRLTHALARRGHEVTVVYDADAYRTLSKGAEPPAVEQPPGVKVVPLSNRLGGLSLLMTQQTGRPVVNRGRIQRLLTDGKFDVIHYHNVSLVGGPAVLSYGNAVKLYEAHEHWLVCPTHVLWRHGREVCTGRECIRCTLRQRRPPQLWRHTGLLERNLEHVDAFIAKSEFSRDMHAQFGFPRHMEVIPYFLPEPNESDAPVDEGAPHARPYFLFVGRLERIKGLDDVIPVFRAGVGADLVIAGDGEHRAALQELAGDSPHVRFLGRVAPDALRRYYQHALALVVPSVCYETFGIILIEAFRQGTPVIARRIGPFPEIVNRGGGVLFSNSQELTAALQQMQHDPRAREQHARAGRNAFLRHWTEAAVMPRYFDLIRRVALRRGQHALADSLAMENVA